MNERKYIPESYTLHELSRRLNYSPDDLLSCVRSGRIEVLRRPADPEQIQVGRDAAIVFCNSQGKDPMRVM